MTILVSVQEEEQKDICHPISPKSKHLNLPAYISVAGDSLTSFIITPDSISDLLSVNGICEDEDAIEYVTQRLVPYITSVKTNTELASEDVLILMDSINPSFTSNSISSEEKLNQSCRISGAYDKSFLSTGSCIIWCHAKS
jgi:hypothetical protein